MSTIESLNQSGLPYHQTKSLCSPSVFNTATTRATSLLVAVGNPYTLLAVEKKMDKNNRCWAEYLRQCFEANTFVGIEGVIDRAIQELHHLVEKKVYTICQRECLSERGSIILWMLVELYMCTF